MSTHSITIAGCVIPNEEGKILLMHRNTPRRMQWEIPGGKVESAEHPEAAAIRELKEELGVTVSITREIGRATIKEDDRELHFIWHLAFIEEGTPTPLETDVHDQVHYFTWDEIEQMHQELSVNTMALLTAYTKGEVEL